jgi:hypothetical protein
MIRELVGMAINGDTALPQNSVAGLILADSLNHCKEPALWSAFDH